MENGFVPAVSVMRFFFVAADRPPAIILFLLPLYLWHSRCCVVFNCSRSTFSGKNEKCVFEFPRKYSAVLFDRFRFLKGDHTAIYVASIFIGNIVVYEL